MSIPAGWYPDPHPDAPAGTVRWWDGAAWSESTQAPSAGSGSSSTPTRSHTQTQVDLEKRQPVPSGPGFAANQPTAQQGGHQPAGYQPGYQPQAPAVPQMTHCPDGTAIASPWIRLGAYALDAVIGSAVSLVALVVLGAVLGGGAFALLSAATNPDGTLEDGPAATAGIGLVVLLYVLLFVVSIGYTVWAFVLRVRTHGASPGKQVLGLKVRTFHTDGQLTYGQVWGRIGLPYLAGTVTFGLAQLVDVLWLLWDRHVQCLHDKAVGTVVVNLRTPSAPPDHPGVQLARAFPAPRGWVADGPVPPSTATATYRG